MVSEEDVKIALDRLTEPLTGLSFLQAGLVKNLHIEENTVKITLQYPSFQYPYKKEVKKLIKNEVRNLDLSCEVLFEEAEKEVHI